MERLQKFALEHTVATAIEDTKSPTIIQQAIMPPVQSKSSPRIVQEGYNDSIIERSFESSDSLDNIELKSPIPCSDDGEDTKVMNVAKASNTQSISKDQTPKTSPGLTRSGISKLPVSMPRAKSKEKDGVMSPASGGNHVAQEGSGTGIRRSISQPETLRPQDSQGQRGGSFYKM